jgi:putative hydrolase of the HAD superfamily
MSKITSIIFDLDGTLYSSRELAAEINRVASEGVALQLGIDPDSAKNQLSGAKAALQERTGHEATLSAACLALDVDIRQLHGYLAEHVSPEKYLVRDDRLVEMLERLCRYYGLYIYTNNNRSLADRIIRSIGVAGLFSEIFSIEDFWRGKPDRLALAKLFAAIGAEPIECLFVGDRYDVDLRLPEEHGCRVWHATTIEELLALEEFCRKGEKND